MKALKKVIVRYALEAVRLREEAKYLRGEARQAKDLERTYYLRSRARSALLAYGFLRGRSYYDLETRCETKPSVAGISEHMRLVAPFDAESEKRLRAWLTEHEASQ